ncbi:LuxR family transcriptional regulator [Streptomyces sp. SKN60]|uniref:LuxR C-terminal-related transcriptional regulator n=1 Tax=Streptomyces sp. SKN60 TaxID=2855506 RepID=UPI002247F098|nr:LuxR family transcriptional regulator [Streptomyces sp. SKN60]
MDTGNYSRAWPLVGRETQIEIFEQALAGRQNQELLISGPAGVGKSRLAEECLRRAIGAGHRTVQATAGAAAASAPLGAIAHLVPTGMGLSDPAAVFSAVAHALTGTAKHRTVLLVDDLHLLDATSAMLLRQLLDAGAIFLVATMRSSEPVGEATAALTFGDAVRRVDLGELDSKQVEVLLQTVLGGPVGWQAVHELYNVSGGNVLYLRELVLGALANRSLASDGGVWELAPDWLPSTHRLSELIGTRLAAAGALAKPLLELLALCDQLPLADAGDLVDESAMVDMEEAGLIRTFLDGRRNWVTLAHPLYGEVLRAAIPSERRRQMLLEQVQRTEARGGRRREDPLRVASWRLTATGTADPQLLIKAAALARHSHDNQQAINLLTAVPDDRHTRQSRLLQAAALIELGRFDQVETVLAEVDAQATDEHEQLAAAIPRNLKLFADAARTNQALEFNEAARSHVASATGQRLLKLGEGIIRTVSGEPVRGLELLKDLEEDVHQAADINTWLLAAMIKSLGLAQRGRTEEAVQWAGHVYAAHLHTAGESLIPHPASQISPLIVALAESGKLPEARRTGEQALAELVTSRSTAPGVWVAFHLARVEWLAGHPIAARRCYAEAAVMARAQHYIGALRLILSGLAASAAVLGDTQAAQAAVAELEDVPATGYLAGEDRLGEAWLHASCGRLAQARAVLLEGVESARRTGHLTSEALLLTDIARLGAPREATERLTALAEQCDGTLAPARARFATALAADDPHQLLEAADTLQSIGADLLAAEAATAAATGWRRAGETRRATAATRKATEAIRHCPGARTPLLSNAQAAIPLTTREREVALLAAGGASSKDIAEQLVLSVRTVDNHLQRVYKKLGVATRNEIAEQLRPKKTGSGI